MKLEKAMPTNTLGDWATIAVQKHFEKTIKYEQDVLEDRDPEALHQMRVGMRRLRSAVKGFAPALHLPKAAREKQIGKISRSLGMLRDLDVLLEAIETRYKPALPKKEKATLKKALELLAEERRHAFRVVSSTLKENRYLSFKEKLSAWLENPRYEAMAQLPIQEVLPDLLLPEVSTLFLHPGWTIGVNWKDGKMEIENLSAEAVEKKFAKQGEVLHDLRKQVKRVRYQMNLFTEFYGSAFAEYVDDMKSIQDILGNMQDSVVLAETLTGVLHSNLAKQLPTLAEKLGETRYECWLNWQPLHQKYMKPETRAAFRAELLHPIPVVAE